ncbi:YvrJ family protein [Jeotgalibaca arthritidis]|uniref:YvrJ family protein n=1 Tax=Jeotgalibaca arthritidis TaxID=1868794 RepID=UPI0035A06BF9
MEEIVTMIGNFGFPIVLVIYLFTRFEKQITEVTESIERLEERVKESYKENKL